MQTIPIRIFLILFILLLTYQSAYSAIERRGREILR
jgi:hypothetical protein